MSIMKCNSIKIAKYSSISSTRNCLEHKFIAGNGSDINVVSMFFSTVTEQSRTRILIG